MCIRDRSYVRKYEDSIYFAPIIGYTGKVQEDQLSTLNEQWHQSDEAAGLPEDAPDKYDLNDIVGRIGIEKSMELELQGEKGYSRMYVDNMGPVSYTHLDVYKRQGIRPGCGTGNP